MKLFKADLAMKMTEKELVMAKNLFFKDPRKTFDNDFNIFITREHFKGVHHDLVLLLEYVATYINTIYFILKHWNFLF